MSVDALVRKHTGLAYSLADRFYLPGGDGDDVRQVALIGLWDAARDHDARRGEFVPFACTVIRRHLASALKSALREKHRPLTESARDRLDVHPSSVDPVELIADWQEVRRIVAGIKLLTALERESLVRVVFNGERYGSKRVDNALRRARLRLAA